MAGGEIKSTLTLDVSKFSSALEKAIGGTENLEKHLKSAAKVAADFDKGITGVGNDLSNIAKSFRLLDQTVESMVTKLTGIVARFDQLGQHSASAAKGVEQLGSAVKKATSINADQWIKKYTNEIDKLAPALKNAIAGLIDFDRANIASANTAEKAAGKSAEARLKVLSAEREANRKIIADREKTASELLAIEEQMRKRADANIAAANRQYFGKNYNHPVGQMWRSDAAQAQNVANTAAAERAALEAVIKEMKWQNAEIEKQIALEKQAIATAEQKAKADKEAAAATTAAKKAEREAAQAAKEAAAESARYARDAARERMQAAREAAAFEREQARQIAQMWKGMGQLWAASKIERGIGATVEKSATMQDVQLRVKAWGIKGAELEEFNKKAYDLARQESYLSNLDAIQGRLTAIASLGYNNVSIVDATVGESLRTVQALKTLGYEVGNVKDIQRNLYGIAETRQVMNDPRAINRTFDTAFRLVNVSEGKITLADIETILRNLGPGANQISDKGLMNITALAEQAKVSGSHGAGGAGAGVSSVGTMIKMAQLYAMGKPISNTLLEQLAGAGLTAGEIESMESLRGGRAEHTALLRAMKSSGLKNQQEIMEDPVSALWKMRDPIMKYISGSAKNRALYFGDANADTEDEKMQLNALQKFWSRSGLSNKAIAQMVTAMDPRFHERTEHVTESALKGEGAKSVMDMAQQEQNWNLAVQKMKKGVEDLTTAFEPLIKSFSFIPEAIGSVLSAAGSFAKNNPMIASLGLITVGVVGMNLAFKGVINTFGMVGSAATVLKTLASGVTSTQSATVAATTSLAGFGRQATVNAQAAIQAAMAKERLAEAARVAAVRELEAAKAVVASKTGFDRLRAVQEQLIPAQQNAAKATAEHAAAHANVGRAAQTASVAAQAMAGASKLLSGALSLVGGPLGLIAIALTAGVTLWQNWGQAAETAASKASKAADTALEKLQRLKDQGKYGTGELGEERKTLDKLEETLNFKIAARASDVEKFREKVENQRALVEELERREYENQPKPAPAQASKPENVITPDFKLPTAGGSKRERFFEDAFARQFYGVDTRSNIEQLKLDALISGGANYAEQARQEVIKMWMGGDLDDGKDPSKRKFVKGASYDKEGRVVGFNPLKDYTPDQMDWDAKVKIGKDASGKDVKKSLADLQAEIAERKKLADIINGVKYATERAAAADEEASLAVKRLTGETQGQTDAMRALNREFARQEKANPAISSDGDYQAKKIAALTNQAIADYANMGAGLVQKNKEMEAQFLATERERLEAGVQATYEAKRREAQIVMDQLDAQVLALEEAGMKGSDLWVKAIEARKQGEEEFTRYLKNIAEERARALETPMQKMVREWADVYGQLDKLGEQWANGFMDQLGDLITTGKADWRKFTVGMLTDLSKVMLKKSFADLIGGPQGMGNLGLGGLVKKGLGALGFGMGPAPSKMVNGTPAFAEDAPMVDPGAAAGAAAGAGAEGVEGAGGLSEWFDQMKSKFTEMFDSLGATMDEVGNKLAGSLGGAADSVSESLSGLADNTVPQVTEAMGEQVAQTFAVTAAEEAQATANELVTASEYAEEIANEVSAASEYLANGGVADQFGLSFFANGGAFTNGIYSEPTLFKFANGGQFGVMGEAGPEAVMPLSRDGKGRLGVTVNNTEGGRGSGAAPVVNIAITVNKDGGGTSSQSGEDASQWRQMADRVKGIVIQEIATQQRPGGLLYK